MKRDRANLSTILSVGDQFEQQVDQQLAQSGGPVRQPSTSKRESPSRASPSSSRSQHSIQPETFTAQQPRRAKLERAAVSDTHALQAAQYDGSSDKKPSQPKRNMFRYFFGGTAQPEKPETADDAPRSDSLVSEAEELRRQLSEMEKQLEKTNDQLGARDAEVSTLQHRAEELAADYKIKETALMQQKAALEEHMVSVVVQQITDARKAERDSVKEGCEQEYQSKLVSLPFYLSEAGESGYLTVCPGRMLSSTSTRPRSPLSSATTT